MLQVIVEQIELKYLNKVILNAGLGVAFFDFIDIGDPYLYPGEGASVQLVKFRLVVFRPFVGEVLTGRVSSSNKDGLKISLDFFDDVVIPGAFLQSPSEYSASLGLWKWQYEENAEFVLKLGEVVSGSLPSSFFFCSLSLPSCVVSQTFLESDFSP